MEDVQTPIPPDAPILTHSPNDQGNIENQLIDSAWKILYLHYSHYNWIDQKAQWFLTIIGAVEGYLIINFFLNWKFSVEDPSGLIMLLALAIGAWIIVLYIIILQSRPFFNGPDIQAQTQDFWPQGDSDDLRKDTLATLKISYEENVKIINKKARYFKQSIWWICIYFLILVAYFILIKGQNTEVPNDILLGATCSYADTNPFV